MDLRRIYGNIQSNENIRYKPEDGNKCDVFKKEEEQRAEEETGKRGRTVGRFRRHL